jgi:hypothetical protein
MFLQDMDIFALQLTADEERIDSDNISKVSIHNCMWCTINYRFSYSELEVKTIHGQDYSMPLLGISAAGNSIVLHDPDLFTNNNGGMHKIKILLRILESTTIILKDKHCKGPIILCIVEMEYTRLSLA